MIALADCAAAVSNAKAAAKWWVEKVGFAVQSTIGSAPVRPDVTGGCLPIPTFLSGELSRASREGSEYRSGIAADCPGQRAIGK